MAVAVVGTSALACWGGAVSPRTKADPKRHKVIVKIVFVFIKTSRPPTENETKHVLVFRAAY
jgi:hypothetical protein